MPREALWLIIVLLVWSGLLAHATAGEEMLPAGTIIHCTVDEPNFSSKTAQVGDPVVCHLGGLSAFGHSVFARGAMLGGHLQDSKDPGRFVGKGWLELEFDRIILPGSEVLPLQVKIVAAPHLNADREGKMHSGGHPKRDALGWMVPALWPVKILTLPMRGPYPALRGEARLTLRLMEDVEVPAMAATDPMPVSPSRSRPFMFELPRPASMATVTWEVVQVLEQATPQLVNQEMEAMSPLGTSTAPGKTAEAAPSTLIVLRGGSAFVAEYYFVQRGQMYCISKDGQVGVFPVENLDLEQTVLLNRERNVDFVLHRHHKLTEP